MTLKNAFRSMGMTFLFSTTFQILIISVISWIMASESIVYTRDLYQIPLVAFLSSLGAFVFVRKRENEEGRLEWTVRRIFHFAFTGGVVFGALVFFGWVRTGNMIAAFVSFLAIYGIFSISSEIRARQLARRLNEKLNENLSEETLS